MTAIKRMRKAAVLAAVTLGQTAAMAQVVVTYGPDVAAVPTLSQWGVIIMSTLLAVVAVTAIRKKTSSKAVLSIALAAMVSFGAFSGSSWIGYVWANGYTQYSISTGNNGQLTVPSDDSFAYVLNDTSIAQRIISIVPQYASPQGIGDKPACVPGLVLNNTKSCALRTRAPPPP